MKRFNIIIVLSLLFFSCNQALQTDSAVSAQTQGEKFVKNVSVQEFREIISKGEGIILDVRTPKETAQGHLENASMINVFDEDFVDKINLMQKDKEIYVYCKSGGRSAQAAQILSENGFDRVYNMKGGIMAWESAGFPLTAPTEVVDNNINTVSISEFEELIASAQPVLVDFHTLWCAPCRKMAPLIDEIQAEFEGQVIVKRIDADASKDLAKKYQVQGVPEFYIFKNGKQVWKHNGLIEKSEIAKKLEEFIE